MGTDEEYEMSDAQIRHLSWADVMDEVNKLCERVTNNPTGVYGIPTGGAVVATLVAARLSLPLVETPDNPSTLVVDDLVDTGRTMSHVRPYGGMFTDALFRKPWSPATLCPNATETDAWLAFPWERDNGDPVDAVIRLIQHLGEDPTRDGLLDTPRRVTKAYRELTKGYRDDPAEILSKTFDVPHDQMIVVKRLPFVSLCEHHLLPFTGHATIGYISTDRVVGLSKLGRLVDAFANRLQVQERLTDEIADAIETHLRPLGVGVIVSANHSCMALRGVKKHGEMVTSAMRGVMRDREQARHELLTLHTTTV